MIKRRIMLLILFSLMFITGCASSGNEDVVDLSRLRKLSYAQALDFTARIVIDGRAHELHASTILRFVTPSGRYFNPLYTDFILVRNSEEVQDLPDNIIAAWARSESWIEGFNSGLYWAVNIDMYEPTPPRPPVTFEEFDLSYPLTVEDLIDNWEKVFALLRSFDAHAQRSIRVAAWEGRHWSAID